VMPVLPVIPVLPVFNSDARIVCAVRGVDVT
jgi:hypothetical protein